MIPNAADFLGLHHTECKLHCGNYRTKYRELQEYDAIAEHYPLHGFAQEELRVFTYR